MKLTADFHTHTVWSDGKNTVEENAARAKELGLRTLAITEHGYSHIFRGLKRKETAHWLAEIEAASDKLGYPILRGMECNIRGLSGLTDFTEADYENFDVFLCGIHVVIHYESRRDSRLGWKNFWQNLRGKPTKAISEIATRAYINAIEKNPIDIVTHLNYQCSADAVEVAKCCRDYGTYVEISSKKPHLTDEELSAVADTGVRFLINSDAHSVERIGECIHAQTQIERVGIPLSQIDNIDGRMPSFRFAEYKRHM